MESRRTNSVGIKKLCAALELLRTHIRGKESRKELPLQILLTFLLVIQNNGITMKEAVNELGVEQSTISRNIKDLDVYLEDDGFNKVSRGCGLVYRAPNEYNRREMSIFLTTKGTILAREINRIMNEHEGDL